MQRRGKKVLNPLNLPGNGNESFFPPWKSPQTSSSRLRSPRENPPMPTHFFFSQRNDVFVRNYFEPALPRSVTSPPLRRRGARSPGQPRRARSRKRNEGVGKRKRKDYRQYRVARKLINLGFKRLRGALIKPRPRRVADTFVLLSPAAQRRFYPEEFIFPSALLRHKPKPSGD